MTPDGFHRTSPVSACVGMIGDSPLALMTHQAAVDLGVTLEVLPPSVTDRGVRTGTADQPGSPGAFDALRSLAARCDVVTFGPQDVAPEQLDALCAADCAVRPNVAATRVTQDRLLARKLLDHAGFAVPRYLSLEFFDAEAVSRFGDQVGWPIVMKPRHSADKESGTHLLDGFGNVADVFASTVCGSWIVEARVPVVRELTVLVARRPSGFTAVYPILESHRHNGRSRESVIPAAVPHDIATAAAQLAKSVADGLDATGILAVELFLTTGGDLVVKAIATGPHADGRSTLEGTATSQFHNHIRSILDWPLGSTAMTSPAAATVDLIGPPCRKLAAALSVTSAHVHLYASPLHNTRTFGHVTALGSDRDEALDAARMAAKQLLGG